MRFESPSIQNFEVLFMKIVTKFFQFYLI